MQTPDDYRDAIGSMLEEVNRLTELVDSLLTISRADAGRIQSAACYRFLQEMRATSSEPVSRF